MGKTIFPRYFTQNILESELEHKCLRLVVFSVFMSNLIAAKQDRLTKSKFPTEKLNAGSSKFIFLRYTFFI